ncbi:MAG: cytochrome c family protein [Gammaproteobacteria bacterium]|nr:cytochrome c family protein [Gammaproteobacteria bacterium]
MALIMVPVFVLAPENLNQPGDPVNGKLVYEHCQLCHALQRNQTGPKHCNLFERKAGTVKRFDYSDAMRKSNITWNAKTLDTFLASPFKFVPEQS